MLFRNTIGTLCVLAGIVTSPLATADTCGNDHKEVGADFTLTWSSANLGSGFGITGFSHFDADQDNLKEFLFSTADGYGGDTGFVVVEYNEAANDYSVLCQSLNYPSAILHVLPFSNSSIAHGSLIVLDDGTIYYIDHAEGIKNIALLIDQSVNDILIDDVDNDSELEIAILTDEQILLYNLETFSTEQTIPHGGNSFTTGQFVDNTGIEIAINTGFVLQIDNVNLNTLWDYSAITFSNSLLSSGDIDNDGLDELIGADESYRIIAYNADIKGILWEHVTNDLRVGIMHVLDVNNDNIDEIVYSDIGTNKIHALVGKDATALWEVTNPDAGVNDFLFGDFDNNTDFEIVLGTSDSGLYVVDVISDTVEWQLNELSAPYRVAFSDIDNDDILDKIYASAENIVTAMQGDSNDIVWQTPISGVSTELNDIESTDIDGDNNHEILIATDASGAGAIHILDANTGINEGTINLEADAPIYALSVADIDANDELEIIAGGGKVTAQGYAGTFAYEIDGTTHNWEWTFPSMGKKWDNLIIMESIDFDGDNNVETIAVLDQTYIINPETNGLSIIEGNYASLAVTSNTDNSDSTLYLGGTEGSLYKLEANGTSSEITSLCGKTINALESINALTLAFTCENRLGTYNLITKKITWQTAAGAFSNLGANDQLKFASVSEKNTLLVGGSRALFFVQEDTINTTPVANDESYSGHSGETISATLNGNDPSSTDITFGVFQQPAKGSVVINNVSTGDFTYTPNSSFVGTDKFVFYVNNGTNTSNLATASIEFINTVPTVVAITENTHWNSEFSGQLVGTDTDNDPLQFEILEPPVTGILTLSDTKTGAYTYVNTNRNVEQVSFSYRAFDGTEWSTSETVIINLLNTAPTAKDVFYNGTYITGISTRIEGGEDEDGDTLTYELIEAPHTGSATISSEGLLTYNALGRDGYQTTITYRIFDGKIWSEPGMINVTILGADDEINPPAMISDENITQSATTSDDGGSGALNYWLLILMCLTALVRRHQLQK